MTIDERERERLERVARNRVDAAAIVAELRSASFGIEAIADLFNRRLDYREAIPILLSWLPRVENPDVKEDLVRALSVKWAKPDAVQPLITEFERADDPTGTGLRWTIGNALEVLADDAFYDDIVRLAQDRRYGRAREMLVVALGNMRKTPQAVDTLVGLLDDEEVAGHALVGLRKLAGRKSSRGRLAAARERIESFLDHPKTWVRNEAKKILAKLDKHAPGADGGRPDD